MKKRYWLLGFLICLILVAGFILPTKHVVPILMYHSVKDCEIECPANTVRPATFERQMAFLQKNNYQVISVDEYVFIKKSGKSFPPKAVVLTFDDGYINNYRYAFPILKKYGYPATVFIPPNDIGTPGYLTWEQIKEMDLAGFKSESHTLSQAYLPDIEDENLLREEIVKSKEVIESQLGRTINYLAYPSGGFSEKVKLIVKEAGYKAAFATNRGYDRYNKDLFEINRIRPKDSNSDFNLMIKLSGFYNLLRKSKKPF